METRSEAYELGQAIRASSREMVVFAGTVPSVAPIMGMVTYLVRDPRSARRVESRAMRIERIEPGPGRESVWDYPRPPRVEPVTERVEVRALGVVVASTTAAMRVLETSHPPVYYVPPEDIRMELLERSARETFCEFKGLAGYYDLATDDVRIADAGWFYPQPSDGFESIRDHVAFYPSKMDACFVDGEKVEAQPGDFYGGWITSRIVGPFKGAPGTSGW